ncbi:MAG TPA: hypothetical protein VJ600_00855 [Holophagaceae bacterium]|nr:hypothetical protein [Holophagaceae bacterium]
MAMFQGLFFTLMGVLLVLLDLRSLRTAWLPAHGTVRREERPALYWALFILYAGGGLWLAGYGLALLGGYATPLPLGTHPR